MRLAGRLAALERHLAPLIAPDTVTPHPLPDLAGASAEAIVAALFDALGAAHGGDTDWPEDNAGSCPACMATVTLADRYAWARQTDSPWPPPLLHPFDAEYAWRLELRRWRSPPDSV